MCGNRPRADISAGYCYISGMAGKKLFVVKFMKYSFVQNPILSTVWFFDDRVSLYYDSRTWWISGVGGVTGSDLRHRRPMMLQLDSDSEITYLDRTWKYGEFGKLTVEIENIKLERALEAL